MKSLIIIGAGGFGREVAWLVERINKKHPTWHLIGFLDDDPKLQGNMINQHPVLGMIKDVTKFPDVYFVCTVGAAAVRKTIIGKVKFFNPFVKFATLIDPSVEMSNSVSIGEGTIICAHSILTVNIEIGQHVIINLDCTVGHDAVLKDFVTLYPSVNISGMVEIGECCECGTGMQIIQGKRICDGVIVGAGAVVVKDLQESGTYVGVPARKEKIEYFNTF